jgi:hypothetical protein
MAINIERPDFDEPREQDGFRREDEVEYYEGESPPG